MSSARACFISLLCVIYFVAQVNTAPPQTSRYSLDSQNVKYNQRYYPLVGVPQPQPHVIYQQQFVQPSVQRQTAAPRYEKPTKAGAQAGQKKPTQVNKKPVQVVKYVTKKPVAAVAPAKQAPSKYQYAALQASKIAYATPVPYPAPVYYTSAKPVTNTLTKSFYKTKYSSQQEWQNYQKQLQQWQVAVLNGYSPQYDPNATPAYPGNVYIQSAYYPGYSPIYPQPAEGYPQPQPNPQPQPYPEPAEQPSGPTYQEQYPSSGTVVEAAPSPVEQPQPSQPEEGSLVQGPSGQPIPVEQPQPNPEQPQPAYPEQPQPYPEQPQPYPEQPQPYPEQPQPAYPEQPQPAYPEQPQPEQPIEVAPPSEAQPAYPPIGPDPTLPEGENGGETYPGQPPLLPVTTEFPSTTESFTDGTTSASGLLQYCASPRGQYPSPNSCSNYINCWDDVAIEQECPAGLVFGETSCDYPHNVDCEDRPVTTPVSAGGDGSDASNGTSECPSNFGTFKSNKNCGAFIVCVAGEAYEFSCPGGTNYNDHLKVCDYPYRVDCGDLPPNPSPIQPEIPEESSSSGTDQPTGATPEYPSQPQTPYPEQPAPEQPLYPAPEQPAYPAPEQPSYPAPEQPAYPAPEQPAYPAPEQSVATGTPVTETTVVAELPPSYFNQYYTRYQLKRVPVQNRGFVNTGLRCNTRQVSKLSRNSCESVSICRGGYTHLVNCNPGTAYDAYKQKCVTSYRARC